MKPQRHPDESIPFFVARCRAVEAKMRISKLKRPSETFNTDKTTTSVTQHATLYQAPIPRPVKTARIVHSSRADPSMEFDNNMQLFNDEKIRRQLSIRSKIAELRVLLEQVQTAPPSATSLCCSKNCLKLMPIDKVLALRESYESCEGEASKSTYIMKQWQKNFLSERIIVAGVPACNKAFALVYGVSNNKLNRAKKASSTTPTSDCINNPVVLESGSGQWSRERRTELKGEHVIAYLSKCVEEFGERMPHKDELHLKLPDRTHVWNMYKAHCKEYERECCSLQHFCRIWDTFMSHVKIRKHDAFSRCSLCTSLREMKRKASTIIEKKIVDILLAHHNNFQRKERAEYYRIRELAASNPNEVLSMIIDGADQSEYGLPRFAVASKAEDSGRKIKTKLMGALVHHRFAMASLVPMNAKSGSNLVIEMIHRAMLETYYRCQERQLPFPKTLYLQLDNTSGQNKNNYLMAYLSLLVESNIFTSVCVSFLPVGHTHEDVDQMFKIFKQALLKADTITATDLLDVIRKSYSTLDVVTSIIDSQANWKDYFDQRSDFSKHPCITEAASFLIQKFDGETACKVKRNMSDSEWCNSIDQVHLDNPHKFLVRDTESSEVVDIRTAFQSIPDEVREPIEEDLSFDIAKRIKACEARIDDYIKVQQLESDLCKLTEGQVIPFSWDQNLYFELLGDNARRSEIRQDQRVNEGDVDLSVLDTIGRKSKNIIYKKGTFLIVNCTENPFWVAEVAEDVPAQSNSTIKVHWF